MQKSWQRILLVELGGRTKGTTGGGVASKEVGSTDKARVGARARVPRTLLPERMLVNIPRTLKRPGNSFFKK